MMTPLEIYEYKRKWIEYGHCVDADTWIEFKCKDWCRQNVAQHQWAFFKYTDHHLHTFSFENQEDAENFKKWMRYARARTR